jgi:hypothetical protein
LNEIVISISHLPLNVGIYHVKSHQDKNVPYEELTRPAQMNTQADTLATQALNKQHGRGNQAKFIPLPNCYAYLVHKGRYINAHENVLLREALPGADLMDYYKERYKWSAKIMNQIDWTQFGKLHKRNNVPRSFAVKLTTGALATNRKIQQTQDSYHSPCCIECHEIETNSHLYQCSCRQEWKTETTNQLRRLLNNISTAPQVASDIIHGVNHFLKNTQRLPTYLEEHPQTKIGWGMLFRGFMAKTFERRQRKYHKQNNSHSPEEMASWSIKVLMFFQTQANRAWKIRNDINHKTSKFKGTQQQRNTLEAKATALYSLQSEVNHIDRHNMFSVPLDMRLEQSTHQLTAWLGNIRPAFKQAQKEYKALLKSNQSDIREYFNQQTHIIELAPTPNQEQQDQPTTTATRTTTPNTPQENIQPASVAFFKNPGATELITSNIKQPSTKTTTTRAITSRKKGAAKHQSTRTTATAIKIIELPQQTPPPSNTKNKHNQQHNHRQKNPTARLLTERMLNETSPPTAITTSKSNSNHPPSDRHQPGITAFFLKKPKNTNKKNNHENTPQQQSTATASGPTTTTRALSDAAASQHKQHDKYPP